MRRCVPVASLAFGLLAFGSAVPALASQTRYHVGRRIYGCVDPQATVALDGPNERHGGRAWNGRVRQSGRCFALAPALQLDVISRRAGLALVRRVPPRIGEPPLFVLERDVAVLPPALPSPSTTAPRSGTGPAEPAMAGREGTGPSALSGGAEPVRETTGDLARQSDADEPQEPQNPVPVSVPEATSDPAGPGPAVQPPTAPAMTAPAVTPSPVVPAPWPPQARSLPSRTQPDGFVIGLVLTLLLVGAVAAALVVARRRRHFAHVEEAVDWPPGASNQVVELRPAAPLVPTAVEFRKRCAAALSSAGWTTQLTFPGDGSGPDIVARRDAIVAAVRCRASNTAVTGEMVDEAAAMGSRHGATLTLLASNAPFSQRARDEASRHGILLLRDTELTGFVG